jgi:hypothetical protein
MARSELGFGRSELPPVARNGGIRHGQQRFQMRLSDRIARDLEGEPHDTAATVCRCHGTRLSVSADVRLFRTEHVRRDRCRNQETGKAKPTRHHFIR